MIIPAGPDQVAALSTYGVSEGAAARPGIKAATRKSLSDAEHALCREPEVLAVHRVELRKRRRRMPMRFLLLPVIACAASCAQAEPGVISGLGTQSCAELNARTRPGIGYGQNPTATAAFSWVQGYVSAWNVVAIATSGRFADLTSLSADAQWSQIAAFCRSNPDGFVFDAARDLLTRLSMETLVPMASNPPRAGDVERLDGAQ